jgi:hypothetical protein
MRAKLLGFLGVLVLFVCCAPPARADCGGVQSVQPAKRPRTYLPPLAIGDSTMIFALPSLAAEGFEANARGCRQFPEAIALLTRLRHAHSLPHLVVLALGANGSVTDAYVSQALAVLGHARQLVLVTPREAGGGSGSDATTDRAEARAHPGRIHVLDWVAYSAGHAAWFQPDRLHLTFAGAAAFARLLRQALVLAPPPGHAPGGGTAGGGSSGGGSSGSGTSGSGSSGGGTPGKGGPGSAPPSPGAPTPTRPAAPSAASCPTRASGAAAAPGTLDPANPLVALSAPSPAAGGVLVTVAGGQAVGIALVNRNPFAVAGAITLTAVSDPPRRTLPTRPTTATTATSATAATAATATPATAATATATPATAATATATSAKAATATATTPTPSSAAASPQTCVALSAGAGRTVDVGLGPALARLVAIKQRLPVQVTLRVFDAAGNGATVTGRYLLERPPRA